MLPPPHSAHGDVMAFTDIEICSNALIMLGAGTITAFTDDKPTADVCAVRYPMLREKLLTSFPWPFTIEQKALSQDAAAPLSRYSYQYSLPATTIAPGIIAAYRSDADGEPPMKKYIINGTKLLTDENEVWIDHQVDRDEALWPTDFVDLMAHVLATDICLSVTSDPVLHDRLSNTTYGPPALGGNGGLVASVRAAHSKGSPANNQLSGYALINARFGSVPTGPSVQ